MIWGPKYCNLKTILLIKRLLLVSKCQVRQSNLLQNTIKCWKNLIPILQMNMRIEKSSLKLKRKLLIKALSFFDFDKRLKNHPKKNLIKKSRKRLTQFESKLTRIRRNFPRWMKSFKNLKTYETSSLTIGERQVSKT